MVVKVDLKGTRLTYASLKGGVESYRYVSDFPRKAALASGEERATTKGKFSQYGSHHILFI